MFELNVKTQREYKIVVTRGNGQLSAFVRERVKGKRIAVITDTNVAPLHLTGLTDCLDGYEVHVLTVKAGEESKNINEYYALTVKLSELGFTRGDGVLTFGGGVVGDLGAFVASTYMRGITLIALPTTLLSAVDSSVGGKTAIDLPMGKNLVGTFYQPHGVYVNVDYLATLPQREIDCGMGEVVKYAFLGGSVTNELIDKGISEELIVECLKIKRDIVEKDEHEGSVRKLLNLGHTVGHAIESLSGYTLSHGECVARGMAQAVKVSARLGLMTAGDEARATSMIGAAAKDLTCPYSTDEIIDKIKSDKKSDGTAVDFVVINGSVAEVKRLGLDELKELLA